METRAELEAYTHTHIRAHIHTYIHTGWKRGGSRRLGIRELDPCEGIRELDPCEGIRERNPIHRVESSTHRRASHRIGDHFARAFKARGARVAARTPGHNFSKVSIQ